MSQHVQEAGTAKNTTASVQIKSGAGSIIGIWVSSASATPTIKVWDSLTATGTVIANTFTPAPATFYPLPFTFQTGCFVTISGTVDCTVAYV